MYSHLVYYSRNNSECLPMHNHKHSIYEQFLWTIKKETQPYIQIPCTEKFI